jgi:hypothetical protein
MAGPLGQWATAAAGRHAGTGGQCAAAGPRVGPPTGGTASGRLGHRATPAPLAAPQCATAPTGSDWHYYPGHGHCHSGSRRRSRLA